jgi:hypothetical protein
LKFEVEESDGATSEKIGTHEVELGTIVSAANNTYSHALMKGPKKRGKLFIRSDKASGDASDLDFNIEVTNLVS